MSAFWKICSRICTKYLVGPPFAWNTASVWRGMEAIHMWHCWGVMEAQVALKAAFSSPALLYLVPLIFLLAIPHRFPLGFRSDEFASQSSTVTPWSLNQVLVLLAVWAGSNFWNSGYFSFFFFINLQKLLQFCILLSLWGTECRLRRKKNEQMSLGDGCNVTKGETLKGVWILSGCTVIMYVHYFFSLCALNVTCPKCFFIYLKCDTTWPMVKRCFVSLYTVYMVEMTIKPTWLELLYKSI